MACTILTGVFTPADRWRDEPRDDGKDGVMETVGAKREEVGGGGGVVGVISGGVDGVMGAIGRRGRWGPDQGAVGGVWGWKWSKSD